MRDDDGMIMMERYEIGFLYPGELSNPENGRIYYLISIPDNRCPLSKEQQELIIRMVADMRERNDSFFNQKIKLLSWPDV